MSMTSITPHYVYPLHFPQVLRAAEACGIQHVHVIESISEFLLPAPETAVASRGQSGSSSNPSAASRWLSIHRYRSSVEVRPVYMRAGAFAGVDSIVDTASGKEAARS